jgi:hypothetical protein
MYEWESDGFEQSAFEVGGVESRQLIDIWNGCYTAQLHARVSLAVVGRADD